MATEIRLSPHFIITMEKENKPLSEKGIDLDDCPQCELSLGVQAFQKEDVKQAVKEAYSELKKMAYDVKKNTYKNIALFELDDLFKDKFGFELE